MTPQIRKEMVKDAVSETLESYRVFVGPMSVAEEVEVVLPVSVVKETVIISDGEGSQ
jgi:hypothetical protein